MRHRSGYPDGAPAFTRVAWAPAVQGLASRAKPRSRYRAAADTVAGEVRVAASFRGCWPGSRRRWQSGRPLPAIPTLAGEQGPADGGRHHGERACSRRRRASPEIAAKLHAMLLQVSGSRPGSSFISTALGRVEVPMGLASRPSSSPGSCAPRNRAHGRWRGGGVPRRRRESGSEGAANSARRAARRPLAPLFTL